MTASGYVPRSRRGHVIAFIRYVPKAPDDAAPMECACGWRGVAGGWLAHRRAVGAPLIGAGKGGAQ